MACLDRERARALRVDWVGGWWVCDGRIAVELGVRLRESGGVASAGKSALQGYEVGDRKIRPPYGDLERPRNAQDRLSTRKSSDRTF